MKDDSKGRPSRIVSIVVVVVILLAVVLGFGYFTNWFGGTSDDKERETFSGTIYDIAFRIEDPSTLDDDLVEIAITVGPMIDMTSLRMVFFYGPEFNATKLYEDYQNSNLKNPTIVGDVSFVPPIEDCMLIPRGYLHEPDYTYLGIELSY